MVFLQTFVGRTQTGRAMRAVAQDQDAARLMGADLTISSIRSGELAARFGFVPRPVPPEGQPDC